MHCNDSKFIPFEIFHFFRIFMIFQLRTWFFPLYLGWLKNQKKKKKTSLFFCPSSSFLPFISSAAEMRKAHIPAMCSPRHPSPAGPSQEMLWGLGAAQSTRHIPSSSLSKWKAEVASLCREDWNQILLLNLFNGNVMIYEGGSEPSERIQ